MPQVVTNMTQRLVLVRLRSGTTVYLGAGESTAELADIDVRDNPRLEPLLRRGVIRLEAVAKSTSATSIGEGKSKSRSSAKSSS